MARVDTLCAQLTDRFSQQISSARIAAHEVTLELLPEHLLAVCLALRDESLFQFNALIDICGVDYLHYGLDEWTTEQATQTGFERGVTPLSLEQHAVLRHTARFAVVYHLLSLTLNQRLRLRVFLPDTQSLALASVTSIWPAANWFEREAFDLFGIHFEGHPDLRRLLTDYGFIGHPFRKDFPLIGNVEVRYDAQQQKVVYEPVSISARILEPKVIRHDNRYELGEAYAPVTGNS